LLFVPVTTCGNGLKTSASSRCLYFVEKTYSVAPLITALPIPYPTPETILYPLCFNIDVASTVEADYEIFESPESEHSEKGHAA
jgi:hypothetical protein